MRLVLQVKPGGRKTWLSQGQKVCVGRTDEADFVVPDDAELSVLHFAIRCGATECFVQDLSDGGTSVNGEPIAVAEATLNDGDEIQAGQTKFAVHIQATPMDSQLISPELQARLAAAQIADFELPPGKPSGQDQAVESTDAATRPQHGADEADETEPLR